MTTFGHKKKSYKKKRCHSGHRGHCDHHWPHIKYNLQRDFKVFFGFLRFYEFFLDFWDILYLFFGFLNFSLFIRVYKKKHVLLAIMAIAATLGHITGDLKIIQTYIAYVFFRSGYPHQHT